MVNIVRHLLSRFTAAVLLPLTVAACGTMSASGPTTQAIGKASSLAIDGSSIAVIDVTNDVARHMIDQAESARFSEVLGDGAAVGTLIGKGDVLEIAIWEAPPAALFGNATTQTGPGAMAPVSRTTSLPDQTVDDDGRVQVPFAGSIQAAGRTPRQIEETIVARLAGKAHQPQAIVRIAENANRTVTVVGEVTRSARVPLGPQGERLLDVIASVGGTRQPVLKTTIQIARNSQLVSMPLESVIRDPRQNVRLKAGDVVTALFQPYSFTALGATGRNEEVPFEATGLTLSQALGRASGLQDTRSDAKGVFIFRFEPAQALAGQSAVTTTPLPNGTVPVIYRLNLRDPRSLFIAQTFPIRDKDVLYVSNAPITDVQKVVNIIFSALLPITTAVSIVP
jgi:polysaccharide biosynthesis/export protein